MSRVGKLPIDIPSGVTVTLKDRHLTVKGTKGVLEFEHRPEVKVALEGKQILVTRDDDHRISRSLHGTTRAVLQNMVTGVSVGFKKVLEIRGTGYRAAVEKVDGKDCVVFKKGELGFSHPIYFEVPGDMQVAVTDKTKIELSGRDKAMVGLVASKIRALRPPDSYKGKGIRYAGEYVKTKAGKASVK